jgi:hypothetical protein
MKLRVQNPRTMDVQAGRSLHLLLLGSLLHEMAPEPPAANLHSSTCYPTASFYILFPMPVPCTQLLHCKRSLPMTGHYAPPDGTSWCLDPSPLLGVSKYLIIEAGSDEKMCFATPLEGAGSDETMVYTLGWRCKERWLQMHGTN